MALGAMKNESSKAPHWEYKKNKESMIYERQEAFLNMICTLEILTPSTYNFFGAVCHLYI
jgi:hypothetical protein